MNRNGDGNDERGPRNWARLIVEGWFVLLLLGGLVAVALFVGRSPNNEADVRTGPGVTTTARPARGSAKPGDAATTTTIGATSTIAPTTTATSTTTAPPTTTTTAPPPPPPPTFPPPTFPPPTTAPPAPIRASAALVGCRRGGPGTIAVVRITQTSGAPARFAVTAAFVDPYGGTNATGTGVSRELGANVYTDTEVQIPSTITQGGCVLTGGPTQA